MVKASFTDKDGRVVILGLSDGNVDRLRDGMPIHVDLRQFGIDGTVYIMHGTTEADIVRHLSKHIRIPS